MAAACASVAGAAEDDLILISRQSAADGGAGGDSESFEPSISADGRYVAFASFAANLSAEDNDAVSDIFVRDTQTNTTTLISRKSAFAGGAGADLPSRDPSISADGRYVAFASFADNLSAEDNAVEDIFVRDILTKTTTLVSRQSGEDGGDPADAASINPSISADGRYVAFESQADNLSAEDDDTVNNIFVRDTQEHTTTLASRQSAADGGEGADGHSFSPGISADGRYVAFESQGENLSDEDDDAFEDIFVRDLQTNTTTLVSRQGAGDGGAPGDAGSEGPPSLSADGRYIAFESYAENLSTADDDSEIDVFVRDLQAETTTLVSRESGEDSPGADGASAEPSISGDGRFVAFASTADNLSDLDLDGNSPDIFLRDVLGEPPAPIDVVDQLGPAPQGPPDTDPPGLGASRARSPQPLGKPLKVLIASDEDASVTVTAVARPQGAARGAAAPKGKAVRFRAARAQVRAGVPVMLRLRLGKAAARRLRAARKARARITIRATDAAANSTVKKLAVVLR